MEPLHIRKQYEMHVPVEQYGFISCHIEGTVEEAVEAYREIQEQVKVQPKGLSDSEFRELYDKVAKGVPVNGDPGIIEQLNPHQRFALNEVKKFIKRNK